MMLWQPPAERASASALAGFMRHYAPDRTDYPALWRWSVEQPAAFWRAVWEFTGVIGDGPGGVVVDDIHRMPGA